MLEVWLKLTVEDIVRHLNKRERNTILENLIEFPRLIERKTNTIYLAFFLKLNEIIPDGLILTISLKMMKKVSVKTIYSKNLQRIVESLSNRIITLCLFDPQTSGGLLISLAKEDAPALLDKLKDAGLPAEIVGEVLEKTEPEILVTN